MENKKLSVFFVLKTVGASVAVLFALLAVLGGVSFNSFIFSLYAYIVFCCSLAFICIITLIQAKKNGDVKGFKRGIAVSVTIYVITVINVILLFVCEPFLNEAISTLEMLNGSFASASIKNQYVEYVVTCVNAVNTINVIHTVIFSVMILNFALYAFNYSIKKYPRNTN